MKIRIMENYKEKYEQGLERAKSLIGDTIIEESGQHIAEVIFPELKESEDEKIRKELLKFIKNWKDPNNMGRPDDKPMFTKNEEQCDKYIAWLEKQREQKLTWTEEDERFFKTVLWHVTNSISNGKETEIRCDTTEWLKSLKERIEQN